MSLKAHWDTVYANNASTTYTGTNASSPLSNVTFIAFLA